MKRGGAREWRHPQGPGEASHRRSAWIGAVVGGLASAYSAQQSNSASRSGGQVDLTHEVNAYPGSMTYRNAGANAAYNHLFGAGSNYNTTAPPGALAYDLSTYTGRNGASIHPTEPPTGGPDHPSRPGEDPPTLPPGAGDPTAPDSKARAGRGRAKPPAGYRYNASGKLVKGKNPAIGGAAPAAPPFQGQSSQTAAAVDNALRTAQGVETGQTTRAAQDYTAGTLRGEDSNAYRSETAGMIRNFDDADYRRYLDALFEADNGVTNGQGSAGGQGSSSGRVSYGVNYATGGPGGAVPVSRQQDDLTGAAAELKRLMAGEDSPGAQAMRERIRRSADEGFNEQLRQRRLEAAGSGMYGGSGQLTDENYAQGRYGAGLADAYAQQDYDTYRQALGLGAAYDTAGLDRAAQERMNSANNATASAGISAGSAAESAAISSRERLARMEALGNAVGMGLNTKQFLTSGMGSLAEGFSGDQRNALNASPDIATMGQSGWLNAGGLSLGSDQARNTWQGNANQLAASRAATGVARGQLAFDRERWAHDVPLTDLSRYQAIISNAYDPFSSQRDLGYDRRNSSPSYTSPVGAGLSGAASGYYLGRDIKG